MGKLKIRGVIPPVITPFQNNGDVDYEGFAQNITKWNRTGVTGYLALASNSETVYLTEDEKLAIVKETVQAAEAGMTIMAGTGMESARETVQLTNKVAKLGVHMALVIMPFYYKSLMTSKALTQYFKEVATHSEIPILIYNVPKYTGINIHPDTLAELSRHPNIIGMKDSTGNIAQLAHFKSIVPEDFNLIVGTASALFPALTLGINAGILALANCNPAECVRMIESYLAGDLTSSRNLYQTMLPVNIAVTETFGIPGLKYVCELMGFTGGVVRNPMQDLSLEDKVKVKEIFDRAMRQIHV